MSDRPPDILFGDIGPQRPLMMVSLFHTEDELYFSIEIPQIFVEQIQQNKTIQFYVIRDRVHASRPISDPDFSDPVCTLF